MDLRKIQERIEKERTISNEQDKEEVLTRFQEKVVELTA